MARKITLKAKHRLRDWRSLARRGAALWVAGFFILSLLSLVTSSVAHAAASNTRQQLFTSAAQEFGVPESVSLELS